MIAVTGVGIICSLGKNQKEVFDALLEFKGHEHEYIKESTNISEGFRSHGAPKVAEVSLSNQQLFERLNIPSKRFERMARTTLLALNAIKEAVGDSKLSDAGISPKRIGIFGGTTLAGTDRLEAAVREFQTSGHLSRPQLLSYTNYSSVADIIADIFKWSGHRVMVSTACSSSTVVMRFAQQALLKKELDVAIVFGADPITETSLSGFSVLGALLDGVSTPFSIEKLGISLGEGAAALVLERDPSRDVQKYAWLGGVGVASEGYHLTAPEPNGRGAMTAMNEAIVRSKRVPQSIEAVIAHGTGTELNDVSEGKAIKQLFKTSPLVLSTKGATGHTLGGAGAINAVIACLCLKNRSVPASPMFTSARRGIDINISNQSTSLDSLNGIMTNSFGFGGSVASAAFFRDRLEASDDFEHQKERVVITGLGVVTPLGTSREVLEKAILEGTRHFIEHQENVSFTGQHSVCFSGKIDLDSEPIIKNILRKSRHFRKMDRTSMLSYVATVLALQNAKYRISSKNQKNIGIFLGSDTGPIEVLQQFYQSIVSGGRYAGNPSLFPNTVLNACLGYITIDHLIAGPSVLISQGEVASGVAMALSQDLLSDASENCNAIVCGGVDELTDFQIKGHLDVMHIPSGGRVDSSTEPFSNDSAGFLLGEASIVFLLEKESEAKNRNASIEAEFVGSVYSGIVKTKSNEVEIESAATVSSVTEVMNDAVRLHGMPDVIIVNGSGLPKHDKFISAGILNSVAKDIKYYSPLRVFGNCRGTSGALGVFSALTAIKHQVIPSDDKQSLSCAGRVQTVFVLSVDGDGYAVVNIIRKNEVQGESNDKY